MCVGGKKMREQYVAAVTAYADIRDKISCDLELATNRVCHLLSDGMAPKSGELPLVQRILSYWGRILEVTYYSTIIDKYPGKICVLGESTKAFYELKWDVFDGINLSFAILQTLADDIVNDSRGTPVRLSELVVLDVRGEELYASGRESIMDSDWWEIESAPGVILVEESADCDTDPADCSIVLSSDTELKYIDQRLRRWNAKDGWYHN